MCFLLNYMYVFILILGYVRLSMSWGVQTKVSNSARRVRVGITKKLHVNYVKKTRDMVKSLRSK